MKHCKLKSLSLLFSTCHVSKTIIFLSFFQHIKANSHTHSHFAHFSKSFKTYLIYYSKLLSYREFLYFYCAINIVYYLSVVCLKFFSSYYIIPTFIISNFNEVNAFILHVFKYCQSPSTVTDTRDICIYYKISHFLWY